MMEIELPPAKQSLQDIDLIDILWKQDIDLGVGREVFDYNQRQKEYELEKQKKLEKEHQEQLLKEQEKALYAHLQLDEETGEFIPLQPESPMEAAVVTQSVTSALQSKSDLGQQLSIDECMKILADTFQYEAPQMTFQTAMVPSSQIDTSQDFLSAEQHPLTDSWQNPTTNTENMQEMEELLWEELLSIPELQCLSGQIDNLVDLSLYSNSDATMETTNNYMFHAPMLNIEKPAEDAAPVFSNDFVGPFTSNVPTVNTNSSFNVESFCDDIFTLIDPKMTNVPFTDNSSQTFTELLSEPVDITDLSLCKAFNENSPTEFNDSDSGISINTSPCATSPGQSMGSSIYGDAHYECSDSEMDDKDSTIENVQNPTEKFPVHFTEDEFYALSPIVPHDMSYDIEAQTPPEEELPVKPGLSKAPFTKDKSLSRLEARFTRDEQRAKALNVPFSVDKIVNLPVDDFNVLMSKHQFNEAQLALIRDIRRRGKNKVAAQNCRKRKMENIVELETDLDKLKYEKEKLLAEKDDYNNSLRLLKKQLGSLYMEVFTKLRDDHGQPYSPQEYSLQQTKDGNVFLVPKAKKIEIKKEQI